MDSPQKLFKTGFANKMQASMLAPTTSLNNNQTNVNASSYNTSGGGGDMDDFNEYNCIGAQSSSKTVQDGDNESDL